MSISYLGHKKLVLGVLVCAHEFQVHAGITQAKTKNFGGKAEYAAETQWPPEYDSVSTAMNYKLARAATSASPVEMSKKQ